MKYIVQENVFRHENYNIIFETLDKLGLEYEVVKFKEDGSIDVETKEDEKVFVFGSIRMARLSAEKNWYPGSFFGNHHDFNVYGKHYGVNMLNHDSIIHTVDTENLFKEDDELLFIRPCKDSKIFNGQVFTKTKWEDTVERMKVDKSEHMKSEIQVTKPKVIYREARCWVVDGKVVTSSYYRFNGDVAYIENVEEEALEFAQKMVDIFQVDKSFVIDICFTPDGWKVVEVNCVNCSGFYKGDLEKLVMALEDKFN